MGGGGGRKGAEWPKTENSEISEPWFKWETMGTMGKIPYEWRFYNGEPSSIFLEVIKFYGNFPVNCSK